MGVPETVIPRRHGADLATGRRMGRQLRWMIRGNPQPTPQQWQALGMGLMDGDLPMDRLVAWMYETGFRECKAQFEHALQHGIAALPEAPAPLREFFASVDTLPAWADPQRMAQGTRACHVSGMAGLYALREALMSGYQASAINKTLVLTGALERGAPRRIAETTKWWVDVTAAGGLHRFSEGFKSTLQVRLIHGMVRRQLRSKREWKTGDWGLPVNQTDMLATNLGFSVIFLLGQRMLGVPLPQREAEDIMHLWRVIGWLMGVEARWLPQTEAAGRVLLYQILLTQAPPDESSVQLGRALMNEPLTRHYRHFKRLQARYEHARHLSLDALFLGRDGMRSLGLPPALPWYPLLSAPRRALWHLLNRLLPGGAERLARRGRAAQAGYLTVLFGPDPPAIKRAQAGA